MSDSSDESGLEWEIPEHLRETLPNDKYSDIEVSDEDSDDEPAEEEEKPRKTFSWTEELCSINIPYFAKTPGPVTVLTKEKKEFDFFSLIFPEFLFELLSQQTNLFARQQQTTIADPIWHDTNPEEIKAFIGIHMIMGISEGGPAEELFWSPHPILSAIPSIMSQTRFEKLLQYFHCSDSTINPKCGESGHDKFHHIRKILEVVEDKCMLEYDPHREMTIDEVVIAYDDRRSRQVKLRVKVWARVDPHNGYTQRMQVYTRKETRRRKLAEMNRVVSDLTTDIQHFNHHVYLCSSISSVVMLRQLEECGIYAIGICHANRPGWPSALRRKVVKKQMEHKTLQCGNLVATSLYDRKQVNFLSTASDPTVDVALPDSPRRKNRKKTKAPVIVPEVVGMYSQFITGVHRADTLRIDMSCAKRTQNCWRYLFWFLVDTAISNAYILMSESPYHQRVTRKGKRKRRKLMDFRQNLAEQLVDETMKARKREMKSLGRIGAEHMPEILDEETPCVECSKEHDEETIGCGECKVNLCIGCYKPYHVAKYCTAEEDADSDKFSATEEDTNSDKFSAAEEDADSDKFGAAEEETNSDKFSATEEDANSDKIDVAEADTNSDKFIAAEEETNSDKFIAAEEETNSDKFIAAEEDTNSDKFIATEEETNSDKFIAAEEETNSDKFIWAEEDTNSHKFGAAAEKN